MRLNQRFLLLTAFFGLMIGLAVSVGAADSPKRTIRGNMTENYKILPGEADSIFDMFSQGVFYGRIRINTFRWEWEEETTKSKDNWAVGVGGSLIFKSAYLHGLGMTAGLYTSQNPWRMDEYDVGFIKSGKDVLSRHKVATHNEFGMTALAQAFVEYKYNKSGIRVGRQIFESLLTKSNDTKMIPNTFNGISLTSQLVPDTSFKAAYFTKQKLRDHTSFHHVLAYGDQADDDVAKWNENDDSAMHKGITTSRLEAKNIHDRLVIVEATNKTLPNLSVMVNYTAVPDLIWTATGELNYAIKFDNGIQVVPGFRYLQQFDRNAGTIGGASLKAKISQTDSRGYEHPFDMDGKLYTLRVNVKKGAGSVLFGYSKVANEADLLTPWRGFPTGGYTRAMAQYNWYAKTATFMAQFKYDFDKAELVPGLSAMIRYASQDFDDNKPDVQADTDVYTLDLIQNIWAVPGLMLKCRIAVVRGDDDTVDMNGQEKSDPSYNEYRFGINYLF